MSNPNFKLFQAFERSSLSIEKTIKSLNQTLEESKQFLKELDLDEQEFLKLFDEDQEDAAGEDIGDDEDFFKNQLSMRDKSHKMEEKE